MTNDQKNFIECVGRMAAADKKKSRILASLKIAQAILESGWGKSMLTIRANNLYGIKASASWRGRTFSAQTQEFYNGANTPTTINALFRAYGSWEESVADHSALLTGLPRYRAVPGETCYIKASRAVHAAGYATDPQYADKLIRLIELYRLNLYDGMDDANGGSGEVGNVNGINQTNETAEIKATKTTAKIRRRGVQHAARSILHEGFNYVSFRDMAGIFGIEFVYNDITKEIEIIEEHVI